MRFLIYWIVNNSNYKSPLSDWLLISVFTMCNRKLSSNAHVPKPIRIIPAYIIVYIHIYIYHVSSTYILKPRWGTAGREKYARLDNMKMLRTINWLIVFYSGIFNSVKTSLSRSHALTYLLYEWVYYTYRTTSICIRRRRRRFYHCLFSKNKIVQFFRF